MNVHVDKAGRLVLPKPIRDRLGLHGEAEVELEEVPGGVTLRAVQARPSMVRVRGLWVHQGEAPKDFDWERHLEQTRLQRDAENWKR